MIKYCEIFGNSIEICWVRIPRRTQSCWPVVQLKVSKISLTSLNTKPFIEDELVQSKSIRIKREVNCKSFKFSSQMKKSISFHDN